MGGVGWRNLTVSNFRVQEEEDKAKDREGVETRGRRGPGLFESEFEELGSGAPQSEEVKLEIQTLQILG